MYYKNDTIIIREFAPQELDLFLSLFENENVTSFLPYKSPEEYKEMFAKALADYQEGSLGRWGIFNAQNNDFIGMCVVRIFADNLNQTEIGYVLSENYWGKGVATVVCKALVDYCLSLDNHQDIIAITDLHNIGSQKVLVKNGFIRIENLVRENGEVAYFKFG
ncbi:GNAT family acetyltransferase [Chryseobacterium piperi]|uniref:GNAT family acetyltransferase n=1 Tax=Chryseobacterium piperi TaxID=558152 RepID=A0A086BCT4_9FLAO|nr:GNAT family N-acetyltransferase [Chryseobacterium piperi]ASW73500.1 N-acetyltransferase [Chryseobacterium piperi]KFF26748.1 GNAT family acetyltransferase [Chryseobacterium piperi]